MKLFVILLNIFALINAQLNGIAPPEVIREQVNELEEVCRMVGTPLDLVFILDSSGSLGDKWDEEVDIIKTIVNTVAVAPESTRIGLVQYAGIARSDFHMNTFSTRQQVLDAIEELRFIRGITRTGRALYHALDEFTTENGMRGPGVRKIAFLLSDGRTNDKPRDAEGGKALRARGYETYIYGTGKYVAIEELETIASPENIFTQKDVSGLNVLFKEYEGRRVCEQKPACIAGSNSPVDLTFVVDASSSVKGKWEDQIKFVKRVMNLVNVHPDAVRVAFVQYTRVPRVEFEYDRFEDNENTMQAIDALVQYNGTTQTDKALNKAAELLRSGRGIRGDSVPKVVIILTDGFSQTEVNRAAASLRSARTQTTVFAVSILPMWRTNPEELRNITGDPRNAFTIETHLQFELAFKNFISSGCTTRTNIAEPQIISPVNVQCTDQGVKITARTRAPFLGKLYMYEHLSTPGCSIVGDGTSQEVTLEIGANECGLRQEILERQRKVQLRGSALLQFHQAVATDNDLHMLIDCLRDAPANFQDVGELRLEENECDYTLRRFDSDGCSALDAKVGELVHHRWECSVDPVRQRFLVHSCIAESDRQTMQLLDAQGCPVDEDIFGLPTYDADSGLVLRQAKIFKFPTSKTIKFTCKLTMCNGAQCNSYLPPICSDRQKRQLGSLERPTGPLRGETITVSTRMINVLESDTMRPTKDSRVNYCKSAIFQ